MTNNNKDLVKDILTGILFGIPVIWAFIYGISNFGILPVILIMIAGVFVSAVFSVIT